MNTHRKIKMLSTLALSGALLFGLAGGAWASEPAGVSPNEEEGARFTAADTTITADDAPVLQAQVSGSTVTLVEGDVIEDIFVNEQTLTEVVVTIALPTSSESITVTTLTGPTWTELASGDWQATFPMPDVDESLSGSFALALVGGPVYDPTFTVKNRSPR